ncbi:hypothetical protein BDF21DRAFT_485470 [Thamnidium elegans]|nr:hypothetical protein BDF21DRAFT_485470 [Thamnidium elegans]
MVRRGIIFYGENMFRNIFDEILQHQCSPSPKQPVASAAILSKRPVRDEFVPSTSLPLLPTENVQETEEPFETTQKLKYHTCTVVLNNTIRQDLPQDDKYTFIQKFNQAMSNKVSKQVQYFQKVPSQRPIYDFLHLHIPKRIYEETNIRIGDRRRMIIRDEYYKYKSLSHKIRNNLIKDGKAKLEDVTKGSDYIKKITATRETGPEAEGGVKPGGCILDNDPLVL